MAWQYTETQLSVLRQAEKGRVCYVEPDGWRFGGVVYRDATMPAPFDLRITTNNGFIFSLAVRVEQTGKVMNRHGMYRCRVTFVGDCEPDVVTGGWMTLK